MFNLTWGQTRSKINGNLSFMKCMPAVTLATKMRVPVSGFHVHQKSVLEVVCSEMVENCRGNVGGCCDSWLSLHA
jgi:hypothetical protein